MKLPLMIICLFIAWLYEKFQDEDVDDYYTS
jgi:uncharacterized protein (DUF2225 family)